MRRRNTVSNEATRQLANLRKPWNNAPTVDRMAFLIEVLAAGALHKRSLPAIPRSNLPELIAPQMEKASNLIRGSSQSHSPDLTVLLAPQMEQASNAVRRTGREPERMP